MNNQEQIHNWLVAAFEKGEGSLTELFYFDRRDNQFFSVLFMDYFLLDENFDLAKDIVSTNYSKETLVLLIDRIKRIEKFHPSIIAIPCLSLSEALTRYGRNDIIQKAETFLNLNQINIENASIWEVEVSSVSIDLTKNFKVKKRKYWWWPW
jgi:hypothetical protein